MNTYKKTKFDFYKKHANNTSPKIKEEKNDNITSMQVVFESGAIWYENHMKATGKRRFEIDSEEIKIDVELIKIEYWSTDDPTKRITCEYC